jgi:hypothetical protein
MGVVKRRAKAPPQASYLLITFAVLSLFCVSAFSKQASSDEAVASSASFYSLEDIPGGLGKRVVGVDPSVNLDQPQEVLDSLWADLMKYGLLYFQ